MSETVDINILRLILGGKHAVRAAGDLAKHRRDMLPSAAIDASLTIAGMPRDALEEIGTLIILYHAARLANGETVGDQMRELIVLWYERQRSGKKGRGRPSNTLKECAVQWEVIERIIREPNARRKAIVADVAQKYGLKRSRVYGLIKSVPIKQILSAAQ